MHPSASASTVKNFMRSGPLPLRISQGSFWERRLRADALTTTSLLPKTIMTDSDVRNNIKQNRQVPEHLIQQLRPMKVASYFQPMK